MLLKLILACFWFSIGTYIYLYCLNGKWGNYIKINIINRLNFLELSLVLFTIYCLISFIIELVICYYFLDIVNLNIDRICLNVIDGVDDPITSGNKNKSTSSLNNIGTNASDGGIMAVALAGGMKLAQSSPTVAGKVAAITGSVAIGATAIAVKNVTSNISNNIGKKSNLNTEKFIYDLFDLTGNDVVDLLKLIQIFQQLQLLFMFLICYNLIIYLISEKKIEEFLLKILPIKIVNLCIKYIKLLKKSVKILIICFIILLIISTLYSYYYLNFFIINLDDIINLYIKYKNNKY